MLPETLQAASTLANRVGLTVHVCTNGERVDLFWPRFGTWCEAFHRCTEAVYKKLDGVSKVTSGYAGGTMDNPTYRVSLAGASVPRTPTIARAARAAHLQGTKHWNPEP